MASKISADHNSAAQQALGIALARTGQFDEARDIVVQRSPWDQVPILLTLGVEQTQRGRMPEADTSFNQVIEVISIIASHFDPACALKQLATALGQVARFEKAGRALHDVSMDVFIQVLCSWHTGCKIITSVANESTNLFVAILIDALSISSWLRSDWRNIKELVD